jgi:hypothetical protein
MLSTLDIADLLLTYNVRRYWHDRDGHLVGIRRRSTIIWFRLTDTDWEHVRTTRRRELGSGVTYHDVSGRRLK